MGGLIPKVSNIMSKKVVLIDSLQPVFRAAQMMSKFDVEIAVVMEDLEPVGMLRNKDIIAKVVAKEKTLLTPTKEVMTSPLLEISPDHSVWEAADLMTSRNVQNIAVVDFDKKVIGTINILDLLKVISTTKFS